MKTTIVSRKRLMEITDQNPGTIDAIIIHEKRCSVDIDAIAAKCRNALVMEFNDVTWEDDVAPPKKQHVEQALEWSKDKEDIVVACAAGKSRSAAIAYVIECAHKNPTEAIKIFDPKFHYPNELIVKYGIDILGEAIVPPMQEYYVKLADSLNWNINFVTKHFR